MNINSGEPPPPGFEDDVSRVAVIERVLKSYKGNALIGLDYTIEVQENRGEPFYHCVLCDKRGDPRTIVQHWTSFQHRLKYLEKHFPTVLKELDSIRNKADKMKITVQKISEAIERQHGRLQLVVASAEEYRRMKTKIFEDVKKKFHHDERNGPNFVNAIDRSLLHSATHQKKEGEGVLDEISSDSDGTQGISKKPKKREQSPAYRVVSNSKNATPPPPPPKIEEPVNPARKLKLPTPTELSLQASHIAQEKYKWEKYRCMLEIYLKQTESQHKEYEKNPEKHPMYPDEWKAFWNRRYKELQKDKKIDPNKYDYKPEWALFWSKRRQELYNQDIEKKKKELKQKLELPENAEETQVDKLKERYKVQAGSVRNPTRGPTGTSRVPEATASSSGNSRSRHDTKVINISDEESPPKRSPPKRSRSPARRNRSNSRSRSNPRSRLGRRSRSRSPLRYERKRLRVRSRSRSMSPFSDDYEYESRHQYERGLLAHRRSHLPPVAPTSRRYAAPPSPGNDEYYEMSHLSSYKHGLYAGHFRNGKESFLQHLKYDRVSISPPSKPEPEPEPEEEGPLTVVAVLRLLTALEDNLGSLGPKMINLLGKALALENVKANSSDELLMNDDNCVFFETAKEKLKGLLIAEVIEDAQKVRAVKKAIKNIAAIVHQVQAKGKTNEKKDVVPTTSSAAGSSLNDANQIKQSVTIKDLPFDRQLVASKLAAALVMQGREDLSTADVDKLIYFFILMVRLSKDRQDPDGTPMYFRDIAKGIGVPVATPPPPQLPKAALSLTASTSSKVVPPAGASFVEDIFETETTGAENSNDLPDKNAKSAESNSSLESLTDSDLQTLLQNFKHLSTEEQHHLIAHLKKLETADPVRVEKLRKFVNLNDLAETSGTSANSNSAQRVRNDASASSTASNRAPSSSKHYEDESPHGSLSRDRSQYSDDEDMNSQRHRSVNAVNPNKFSLDDEDDDDYNFEDVIKVASSNADKRTERSERSVSVENAGRSKAAAEPPAPGTLKSSGDALTFNRAAMNIDLNDTQNLIANLMGNLNQNNAAKKVATNEAQLTTQAQQVPSLLSQKQPPPPLQQNATSANMPFYQQQQQQYQQQYPPHQQQYQQQPQYGGNNAYNQPMGGYMGNNQAGYYNAAYNNGGYPQGPYAPPQMQQQQWPGNQQPPPPNPMGYNMYGGN